MAILRRQEALRRPPSPLNVAENWTDRRRETSAGMKQYRARRAALLALALLFLAVAWIWDGVIAI